MNIENIKSPWSLDHKKISQELQVEENYGLSSIEAKKRLDLLGYNTIELKKNAGPLLILLHQFINPFTLLLAIAAGLSFFLEEWLDGIAILIVVFINAIIGFWMEYQADQSMKILKRLARVPARVMRDGKIIEADAEEVVLGDILFIEAGDMIAADARIIKCARLQTDESALTGESLPAEKKPTTLSEKIPLAERKNMLYKGTYVSTGNGFAIVVHTGMNTELGSIAKMVQGAEQAATPLEKKIQSLSKKLIWITISLVTIIFIAGLLNGHPLVMMLKTSIALAVAAIPEGLPIVATLALAFGMIRMAKHQVIVKKLSSVETLGGTAIICTDKTGTLTQNKIETVFVQVHGQNSRIKVETKAHSLYWLDDSEIANTKAFHEIVKISALCNTATYEIEKGKERASGDPLEVSLLKMVFCFDNSFQDYHNNYPKVDEIPFTSEAQMMATLHKNSEFYVAAKGAIEKLLSYCTKVNEEDGIKELTAVKKQMWLNLAEEKAKSGLRMLAFAYKISHIKEEDFLNNLILAGLVGFMDPPRAEVPAALNECKNAGIKVVMVTGDHPATAKRIANDLGLAGEHDEVIHGNNMKAYEELNEEDKERWLISSVFARLTPAQKLNLVKLYQEKKMVVGMTGDGVNDAPALKKSDIGIAMGENGTQIAQEVADMILKNDSFSSIVLAIKQGRVIFDNIRKFVIFLLSCNLSELFVVSITAILNLRFQLLPLQILFINLVTDVLPALALGVTEASPHIMKRKPFSSGMPIIDSKRWASIFAYSIIITLTTMAAVFISNEWLYKKEDLNGELSNNILFYTLIFSQIFHVFNMSFERGLPFFKSEVFKNKFVWYAIISCFILVILSVSISPLRETLKVFISGWRDWAVVISFSLLSLLLIQFIKKLKWVI